MRMLESGLLDSLTSMLNYKKLEIKKKKNSMSVTKLERVGELNGMGGFLSFIVEKGSPALQLN